jgi:hypothetical protein
MFSIFKFQIHKQKEEEVESKSNSLQKKIQFQF